MKEKTIFLSVIFSLSGILVFGGAGQQGTVPAESPKTVRYAFWGSPDAIGVEGDIIAAFEAKYPSVKIEPVVSGYGDYHSKLLTIIAGGAAPDVMRISTQFLPDFAASKSLVNMDQMAKEHNFDLSMYYKEGLIDCSWEGILYGLPWGTAPIYMIVNLDMFEEAGVPLPSYDWTFDEFVNIAKALTGGSGADKKYGYAMEIQGDLYGVYSFVWANGGDLLDPGKSRFTMDQPSAYTGIQQMADLYKGGFIPPEILIAGTGSASMPSWFVNNKLAMFLGSAGNILTVQNSSVRFGVWPVPVGKNNSRTTVIKSNAISISAKSPHAEEAWLFSSFLRGDEGESLYMKAKRVPPSIDNNKYWDLYFDPSLYPKNIKEVTDLIFTRYGRLAQIRKGYLELEQTITPVIQNIMLGNVTAEQGLKEVAPRVQAILEKH
jgi:multiple sugar transport system substrate-binding protein